MERQKPKVVNLITLTRLEDERFWTNKMIVNQQDDPGSSWRAGLNGYESQLPVGAKIRLYEIGRVVLTQKKGACGGGAPKGG